MSFCLICSVFRFRVYFSVWWYFSNMFVRCYAFISYFCGKSVYIFYFFLIFGLCWCPAGPRQPGTTRDLVRKNTAFFLIILCFTWVNHLCLLEVNLYKSNPFLLPEVFVSKLWTQEPTRINFLGPHYLENFVKHLLIDISKYLWRK